MVMTQLELRGFETYMYVGSFKNERLCVFRKVVGPSVIGPHVIGVKRMLATGLYQKVVEQFSWMIQNLNEAVLCLTG